MEWGRNVPAISFRNKVIGAAYDTGIFFPMFTMEGNATFQVETAEKKDIIFPILVSRPPLNFYEQTSGGVPCGRQVENLCGKTVSA